MAVFDACTREPCAEQAACIKDALRERTDGFLLFRESRSGWCEV